MPKAITPEKLMEEVEKAKTKAVREERKRVLALLKTVELPECKDQARGAKTAIKAITTLVKAA